MRGLDDSRQRRRSSWRSSATTRSLVMACSFQKEESVLIDMLLAIEPGARVFTIDTGVLFPETYETWRKLEDRYGLTVEVFDATPPERHALERRRTAAARARSTRSSRRWRASTPGSPASAASSRPPAPTPELVEWDEARGVWKFNPLADWTEQGRLGLRARARPALQPAARQRLRSIGCAPCTLPGNGREGRWAGQDKTECGLHV